MKHFKIVPTGSADYMYKIMQRKWFLFVPYWVDIVCSENDSTEYYNMYKTLEIAKHFCDEFEEAYKYKGKLG